MNTPLVAKLFPAGEILGDVLGQPTQFVSDIVSGEKEITRESAAHIGAALGTSAEFWLNLQNLYALKSEHR